MVTVLVTAQQDPQFSQSMFSHMTFNPGYAGSSGQVCATALSRQQWVGFGDGAPMSTAFNLDAAISPFGIDGGVGISLLRDQFAFNEDYGVNLSLAYKLGLGDGSLGIGVSGGVYNKALEAEWYVPESEFHTLPSGDPAIPQNESAMAIDFSFGLFYKTNDLYVGASATHLTQPEFDYASAKPSLTRHYYVMAGYSIPLSNPLLEFQPSAFLQSDGSNSQLSINTTLAYNKKIWGGVSYRTDNSIIAMAGVKLFDWVRVGYSYDIMTSDLSSYNDGSHEIMMGFCFDVKKDRSPEQYKSIRYL